MVAVEAVLGVVDVDGDLRPCLVNLVDVLERNGVIMLAEVHDHRHSGV